jgi:ADP-ribose pyrophosphatase YjhB (NUDIX family)
MASYLYDSRIGQTAEVRVGCSAIIWDEQREKLLLTQRSDNGRWCLPGGALDPGENVEECCVREVLEETGLVVQIERLVGVYSTPHRITVYADGNRYQIISLSFEAKLVSGEMMLSNETTNIGYFSLDKIRDMDVMEPHLERIEDAIPRQPASVIK